MTYSQAKIDAYAKLDEAVEAIRAAYRDDDDQDILTGYILLTSAIEFCAVEPDNPRRDDLDTVSCIGWYSKRGQNPVLSYGIVTESLRHYNEVQVNHLNSPDE